MSEDMQETAFREVLVVHPPCETRAIKLARQLNCWEFTRTDSFRSARDLLAEREIQVGILSWCCPTPDTMNDWIHQARDELLIGQPLQWIALIPPRCIEHPETRQFVVDYCFDFHTLPVDAERLTVTLGHAYGMACLSSMGRPESGETQRVGECGSTPGGEHAELGMVGSCRAMRALFNDIRKVARAEAPVLISGESGTGKELAALAVHKQSNRAEGPFVAVNCGALPAGLIQSELFGHEKGAFTGAHQRKLGRIEPANGGTIFLDEVGDLPLDLQVNLLRFLEGTKINRVGGTTMVPVDARVIAATHVNLEDAVRAGRFREDLYFRLKVLDLTTPPLRERNGDVVTLAQFYLNKLSIEAQRHIKGFSRCGMHAILRHHWPGNVRELANRIRRAVVMSEGRYIRAVHLGLADKDGSPVTTLAEARLAAEKEAIESALRECCYNITRAASALGISRRTLYRLIERHRPDLPDEGTLNLSKSHEQWADASA